MKYMVVSSIISGQYEAAVKLWAKLLEQANQVEGVEQLEEWHTMIPAKSFGLYEADNLVLLAKAFRPWRDLLEMELYPVVDTEEARTLLK